MNENTNEKYNLVQRMYHARNIFSNIFDIDQTIKQCEFQRQHTSNRAKECKKDCLIYSFVAIVSMFMVFLLSIGIWEEYVGSVPSNSTVLVLGLTALAIWILIVALAIVPYFRKKKSECEQKATQLEEQIGFEREKIRQILSRNASAIDFLPRRYWYKTATGYLAEVLRNGRARTLGEALDRYEEQMHRWKMERANEYQLALQEQQILYLDQIERNTFWS